MQQDDDTRYRPGEAVERVEPHQQRFRAVDKRNQQLGMSSKAAPEERSSPPRPDTIPDPVNQ